MNVFFDFSILDFILWFYTWLKNNKKNCDPCFCRPIIFGLIKAAFVLLYKLYNNTVMMMMMMMMMIMVCLSLDI